MRALQRTFVIINLQSEENYRFWEIPWQRWIFDFLSRDVIFPKHEAEDNRR